MNKVILAGRLTRDPEIKTTQNDISVCSFCVAVGRRYNREKTDFIDCVAWRRTAENINKYFKKGDMIIVAGAVQENKYTDSDGAKRRTMNVNVEEFYFTGSTKHSEPVNAGDFMTSYENIDESELPFTN